MNNFNGTHNDIVADTLSNLAKRQARREYFKKSLFICCAVFAASVILGGALYIHFSSDTDLFSNDHGSFTLPFSYGLKESLRRRLKLFAVLLAPMVLQFVSGFTLFSQYICVPITSCSGIACGAIALYFTSEIFTSAPSARFTACYILYILLCALYCVACVLMSCVSMSFSASLRHNSRTASRLNENDTAEYLTFFTNISTSILILVFLHCIGLYAVALFK